jgi:hypothetical protein
MPEPAEKRGSKVRFSDTDASSSPRRSFSAAGMALPAPARGVLKVEEAMREEGGQSSQPPPAEDSDDDHSRSSISLIDTAAENSAWRAVTGGEGGVLSAVDDGVGAHAESEVAGPAVEDAPRRQAWSWNAKGAGFFRRRSSSDDNATPQVRRLSEFVNTGQTGMASGRSREGNDASSTRKSSRRTSRRGSGIFSFLRGGRRGSVERIQQQEEEQRAKEQAWGEAIDKAATAQGDADESGAQQPLAAELRRYREERATSPPPEPVPAAAGGGAAELTAEPEATSGADTTEIIYLGIARTETKVTRGGCDPFVAQREARAAEEARKKAEAVAINAAVKAKLAQRAAKEKAAEMVASAAGAASETELAGSPAKAADTRTGNTEAQEARGGGGEDHGATAAVSDPVLQVESVTKRRASFLSRFFARSPMGTAEPGAGEGGATPEVSRLSEYLDSGHTGHSPRSRQRQDELSAGNARASRMWLPWRSSRASSSGLGSGMQAESKAKGGGDAEGPEVVQSL